MKIVKAIRDVEQVTDTEVHVHVSRLRKCKSPDKQAARLFERFKVSNYPSRTGILIFLHLPSKRFAIASDVGLEGILSAGYWREFNEIFTEDLRSTHWENATALAIRILGVTLSERLPRINALSRTNVETA